MNDTRPAAIPAASGRAPLARTCARATRAGFTLIELLVVIGILSILMVVLLPQIIGARETAYIFADKANLKWHYQTLDIYRQRYKRFPKEGGHKFVLASWVEGIVTDKTPENRDRYFTPGLQDQRQNELRDEDPKSIWKSFADLTSMDTAYAGRAKEHLSGKLDSGNEAWIADDNEYGPAFSGGSINVLVGDGNVRELDLLELRKFGYPEDPEEGYKFEVGRASPHPLLKKLDF
jgi:prepilin-type N-terminal cleavage/methylation domain-containing protein